MNLRKSENWKENFQNTTIEIIRWSFDSAGVKSGLLPKENWNYYIYLYEKYCVDFESLWLPDIVKSFSEGGTEYITHNEYEKFGNVQMHGGITYYAKHGYSVGHRCVQIGCDFSHLYDEGMTYRVEGVYQEAMDTARECIERFYVKQEATT